MSQLPVEILSEEEVQRLIAHPDAADIFGLRDAAILSVLYYAAATAAEVTTLNIADIDWNDGILRLRPDLGRPRQVLIEEPLAAMLNHYLEESRKRLLAHGGGIDAGALRPVFVTNKGHRVGVQDIRQILGAHGKGAGVEASVNYNTLRLSRAWHLREAGESPEKIQRMLGASGRSGRRLV
jgi:integrase/recombinase XerD